MTTFCFTNGVIVTPDGLRDSARIEVEAGRIVSLSAPTPGEPAIDLEEGWLCPGFIDTQVNGGGGVLFNDRIDIDGIRAIGAAHARFGTTGFLATLISDAPERIEQALDVMDAAIEAGVPGLLGVHIEGPFLNTERKGIHDAAKFRRLDAHAIAVLTRPRRGRVLLTLAPELCTPEEIATLVGGGVIVSGGHSDADYDTVRAALAAGMTGFTHLFNAMSPLHHRKPGMVGAALEDQEAWCGLIVDGAHVDPAVLRIALRARPQDRMMLVTDAMPSVGAVEKDFVLQGEGIRVVDGICVNAAGTLAGSDLDMASAIRNMVALVGADPVAAIAMASINPATFLGLATERGALAPGLRADWVRLAPDLTVRDVWLGGIAIDVGV
jgi:N-acetylglucosamine-6-phosphate deacetylase